MLPHTETMTVSNEQIVQGNTERPEGFLQFEVGEKLAHDVLGRVMTGEGLDLMRRRQGGFFVTVPRPLPFVLDGLQTERKEGELTFRERTQRIPRQSLAHWPQSRGPEIVNLLALYPRTDKEVPLSHVALAMIPDDASYQNIAKMTGDKSALLAGGDRIKLDLVPKLIIPIGHLALGSAEEHDDYRDRLASLQEEVVAYSRHDDTGEYRLRVPARFFAPARRQSKS